MNEKKIIFKHFFDLIFRAFRIFIVKEYKNVKYINHQLEISF